jgi:hypothetical protein
MATLSQPHAAQTNRPSAQAGYPAASPRFDWLMTGLSTLFMAGLWIDAWAHFHGQVDDSFFTPWHFLFYSAFGLVALFLGYHQVQNTRRGYAFTRALPPGYWLSLMGVALFAVGGLGDMIWHTLFGIESGSEALTSPTHLLLALGMALVFSGPLRSALSRSDSRQMRGWGQLAPALIVSTLLFTLLTFFISYTYPLVEPVAARLFGSGRVIELRQDGGVLGIIAAGAIMSAFLVLLLGRWRLPFGAVTLLLTGNAVLLVILNDFFVLIPAAVITGLLADALLLRWQPISAARLYALTFLVPVVYFIGYFITVQQVAGIAWSIHVWTGATFLAGVAGVLVSLLAVHGPRLESPTGR